MIYAFMFCILSQPAITTSTLDWAFAPIEVTAEPSSKSVDAFLQQAVVRPAHPAADAFKTLAAFEINGLLDKFDGVVQS